MKIGIIGDTHFGAGFNLGKTDPNTQLNSRLLDYSKTFDGIIDQFINRNVELVAITGDIFETRHPTSSQLNVFSKCISKAIAGGMKVVIVVGNHDQQRTIATTTVDIYDSLQLPDISVYSKVGVYDFKDENGKDFHFVLMPYRDRRMVGAVTNAEAVKNLQKEVDIVSKNLPGQKIAIGHFMLDKAITGQCGETFSMSELVLSSSMFDGFDVVIMGHVHQHAILRPRDPFTMYIGSMEKISFGERTHTKVSAIFDTNDLLNPEIIKTNVRNLFEMSFDYTDGDKYYKSQITDKIILDIEKYNMKFNIQGAIVKLTAQVKDNDLYHVNHKRIKEYILSKKVKHLGKIEISSIGTRKLRNKNITETVGGKKAMASFINSLSEPDNVKKKLLKQANSIIEEIEGK